MKLIAGTLCLSMTVCLSDLAYLCNLVVPN